LRQQADVVVRLNSGAFPLEDQKGKSIDLVKLVEKLKIGQVGEWPVWFEHDILELYRARWQVELAFKRLKQLLVAGHVPKTTEVSSRAWLQAKILTALLIEHMIHAGRFFPLGIPAVTRNGVGKSSRKCGIV